jgi:hypothetical protein
MVDNLQQPLPEPQPQKSRKKLWIILGIILGVLGLCSIICLIAVVFGIGNVMVEKAPVEAILDSYMKYMTVKDGEKAYELFSPRVQRQFPIAKQQELLVGNNYAIFEGYQSLAIQNLNISAVSNSDSNAAQGTVAKVTGVIQYEGNIQGTFSSVLEKVDDHWKIHSINVTAPVSKIKP